jgi:site-specific DNA-cytosine methylase
MPKIGQSTNKPTGLRAVGVTCGIGSMLVGARQAGFNVVGNIEWRRYYHMKDGNGKNTFLENFPGAFMKLKIEDLDPNELAIATGCDLAIGHPECGLYSQMQGCNNFRNGKTKEEKALDSGDIPLFLDLINQLRPRFFVMDDLPRSLIACTMEEYHRRLPDYDLFPEWVSNYHYGNVQKKRIRMFMIGALKTEKFVFIPGEFSHDLNVCDVIGDLPLDPVPGEIPNHDVHTLTGLSGRCLHMNYPWHRPTWKEVQERFRTMTPGALFQYHNSQTGEIKSKPGWYRGHWEGKAAVLDGGSGHMHNIRCLPYTIRERARIQGFPDDFIFYGTKFNENGKWCHEKNINIIKQTGKAMPVQFCRYVSKQIAAFIEGKELPEATGDRFARPDQYIDEAKMWFCQSVGYSDQKAACSACWLARMCHIRKETYQIEIPEIDQKAVVKPMKMAASSAIVETAKPRKKAAPSSSLPRERKPRKRQPIEFQEVETEIISLANPDVKQPYVEIERVNLVKGVIPDDYHCRCQYCMDPIGELRRLDGSYYKRTDRRKYYGTMEAGKDGHVAKTPLHLARWAIQAYTNPGDWVLDPTIGAGTTAVESLVQGRNVAGMELQFSDILRSNVEKYACGKVRAMLGIGDARNIRQLLTKVKKQFSLVVNNPPYSGDEHWTTFVPQEARERGEWSKTFMRYDKTLPNLGLLHEGEEYWEAIKGIYRDCAEFLKPGGRFAVGVKDQMRSKQSDQLHEKLADVLASIGLEFEGVAFLNHYPRTLHLNTYFTRYGVHPPYYQSIIVFKKG